MTEIKCNEHCLCEECFSVVCRDCKRRSSKYNVVEGVIRCRECDNLVVCDKCQFNPCESDKLKHDIWDICLDKIDELHEYGYKGNESLRRLLIILSYFDNEETEVIVKGLKGFIKDNKEKFRQVFKENSIRYKEIPYLFGPDILLISYCLENYPYTITDNWINDFDHNELNQINMILGLPIK